VSAGDTAAEGDPVQTAEAAQPRKCGCCRYRTSRFYQLGEVPDPDSPDPDDRGLCAGCFARMLAGEWIPSYSSAQFLVTCHQPEGRTTDATDTADADGTTDTAPNETGGA
jgi:hypothetical protein